MTTEKVKTKPLTARQRRHQKHQQARQARRAKLKAMSAQQQPLQIQDHLIIPVMIVFGLIVVGLALWWLL